MQINQQLKASFYEEPELPFKEKQKSIKIVKYTSIISILLSIILIILSIVLLQQISEFNRYTLIIGGVSNLIISLVALIWSNSKLIINQEISVFGAQYDEQDVTVYYNPLGDTVFGYGSLQIMINIYLIVQMYVLSGYESDRQAARTINENNINNFENNYFYFCFGISLLLIIISFLISSFVFSSFHCSVSFKTLRYFTYFYNFLWAFLCIYGFYVFSQNQQLSGMNIYKDFFTQNQLNLAYWCFISCSIVSVLTYLTVLLKRRKFHLVQGTFLLLVIAVLVGYTNYLARNTLTFKEKLSQNCPITLDFTSRDELQSLSCQKYKLQADKSYDQSCQKENKVLWKFAWEDKLQKGHSLDGNEKENACLNQNCCNLINQELLRMGNQLPGVIAGLTCVGFMLVYMHFNLSKKEKNFHAERNTHEINLFDIIVFILLLIVLLSGYFIGCSQSFQPHVIQTKESFQNKKNLLLTQNNFQQQQNLSETQQELQYFENKYNVKGLFNNNVQQGKNLLFQSQCQLVKGLIQDSHFKGKFDFDIGKNDNPKTQGIRVSILAPSGYFVWENKNSDKLYFARTESVKVEMFNFLKDNQQNKKIPFVSLIGFPNDVNAFLNSELYYCGSNPKNIPHFLIESYVTAVPQQQQQKMSRFYKKNKQIRPDFNSVFKQIDYNEQSKQNKAPSCDDQLKQEQLRSEKCFYLQGEVDTHKGSFSFITKPENKKEFTKQNINGKITVLDLEGKYVPVCNQQVFIKVLNEIGEEVELVNGKTDVQQGVFKIQTPILSNQQEFQAILYINNDSFSQVIKKFQMGGINDNVDFNIGDIHLTNLFGKTELKPENKCKPKAFFFKKQAKTKNTFEIEKETLIQQKKGNPCADYQTLKSQNDQNCPYEQLYGGQRQILPQYLKQMNENSQVNKKLTEQEKAKQIEDIQFKTIRVQIYDIISNIKGSMAVVRLYKTHVDCKNNVEQKGQKPHFIGQSNKEGILDIYNQNLGDYTIQISMNEEYHQYCKQFSLQNQKENVYQVNALIIKREDEEKKGRGVVVLEHSSYKKNGVALGMSTIVDDNRECLVSYINRECIHFKYYRNEFGQAIVFDFTLKKNHLFFVTKMQINEDEQESAENVKSNNSSKKLSFNNVQDFLQEDLAVKVYLPESDYEQFVFYPPSNINDDQINQAYLSWLSFCFNGEVGLISSKPIGEFYKNTSANKKKVFPNSNYCTEFYKKFKYQQPQ